MLKQEILNELIEYTKEQFSLNNLFGVRGLISLVKDVKESFKLEKLFVLESFMYHGHLAKSFIDVPLKCELKPNDYKTFKLVSTNLITGEVVNETIKILGREEIELNDQYEFWTIWLTNPKNDKFKQDEKVMVISKPLELETKKSKPIKLDL